MTGKYQPEQRLPAAVFFGLVKQLVKSAAVSFWEKDRQDPAQVC